MNEAIAFLTQAENIPFSTALVLMLLIGALSMVGIDLDGEIALEIGADVDADAGSLELPDARSRGVPLMITLTAFLLIYGITGLGVQQWIESVQGEALNPFFAGFLMVIPPFLLLMPTVEVLSRVLPQDETYAVHLTSMVGRTGTIDVGTATSTSPTPATFRDYHGTPHTMMVATAFEHETASTGDEVRIMEVGRDGKPTIVVRTKPSDPFSLD